LPISVVVPGTKTMEGATTMAATQGIQMAEQALAALV
jgi:hypothetical protein